MKTPTEKEKYFAQVQDNRMQQIRNWDYEICYNTECDKYSNLYRGDKLLKKCCFVNLKFKWEKEPLRFLIGNTKSFGKYTLEFNWTFIRFNIIITINKSDIKRIQSYYPIKFWESYELSSDLDKLIFQLTYQDEIKYEKERDKQFSLKEKSEALRKQKEREEEDKKYLALNKQFIK